MFLRLSKVNLLGAAYFALLSYMAMTLHADELNVLPRIAGPNLSSQKIPFKNNDLNAKPQADAKSERLYKKTTTKWEAIVSSSAHKKPSLSDGQRPASKPLPSHWPTSLSKQKKESFSFQLPVPALSLNSEPASDKHKPPLPQKKIISENLSKQSPISNINKTFHPHTLEYYRGLYLNNHSASSPKRYQVILGQAKKRNMNALVVDVQPRIPNINFIQSAQHQHFYLIARIVVFPGGLKTYPPSQAHLTKIYRLAQESAKRGFNEIQLDYIRFSDYNVKGRPSLKQRYECIEKILKKMDDRMEAYNIPWGADLFGRVAFNKNDRIGQKLEIFASYADTIYPMLYPSHFYGMPKRMSDPYTTILKGIENSARRVKKRARIVAFIQAFRMNIKVSRLSFIDYISKQIIAARKAQASGYIAWNARNHYAEFFRALDQIEKR